LRFNAGTGQYNHSFIVWDCGSAAANALFTTTASDSAVFDALKSIGALPGDNLTLYSWSKINSARRGPDQKAQGSPLKVEIVYAQRAFADSSVLHDEHEKPFDFRFSGNKKSSSLVRSGCVVCLESCPIGPIGNAAYTMRDLVRGIARFSVSPDLPFRENDEVTIRINLSP
jgi:hypothetical protein